MHNTNYTKEELFAIRSKAAKLGWETRRKNSIPRLSLKLRSKDKATFVECSKKTSLAEIYSSGMQYCWVRETAEKTFTACHQFVYCKDFLHDAIWGAVNNKNVSIHGFTFTTENLQPDLDRLLLAVKNNKDDKFFEKWTQAVKLLNELEELLGLAKSNYLEAEGGKIAIFMADKEWLRAPQLISLYTLVLRAGMVYKNQGWSEFLKSPLSYQSNDRDYLIGSKKAIEHIIEKGLVSVFSKDVKGTFEAIQGMDLNTLHNYSGIRNFNKGNSSNKSYFDQYISSYPVT